MESKQESGNQYVPNESGFPHQPPQPVPYGASNGPQAQYQLPPPPYMPQAAPGYGIPVGPLQPLPNFQCRRCQQPYFVAAANRSACCPSCGTAPQQSLLSSYISFRLRIMPYTLLGSGVTLVILALVWFSMTEATVGYDIAMAVGGLIAIIAGAVILCMRYRTGDNTM